MRYGIHINLNELFLVITCFSLKHSLENGDMILHCAWMLMLKRPEGGQCQKETLSSFLTGRTMFPQTSLAWAMASLSYLVNDFKVNCQKTIFRFLFYSWKTIIDKYLWYQTSWNECHYQYFFCLSIFPFGVLNGSALYRYLLVFIPELCAFMKLSWKDS